MEGYGRWLALAIFIAAIAYMIYEKIKKGNTHTYYVLLTFFAIVATWLCFAFIVIFW